MYQNINSSVPTVGYVRGIDVWYIGCLIFIFIPLMAYALAGFAFRNREQMTVKGRDMTEKMDQIAL